MAELRRQDGTVRWRGETPEDALAAMAALGEEAGECSLHGIDLPAIEALLPEAPSLDLSDEEREQKDAAREKALEGFRARSVKLIEEAPEPETLIINERTGAIEQRFPGSGKVEIDDGEGGTTMVTPTQLAKMTRQRAIDHMQGTLPSLDESDPEATMRILTARVRADAEEAREELTTAEILSRASEAAQSGARVEPKAPDEVKVEGEPVSLRVEKPS